MNLLISEHVPYLYGIIIFSSIFIGCIVAGFLMKKSGIKRETIIYTTMINVVSIVVFSLCLSFFITADFRRIGFVAIGGVAGLIFGVTFSALLHKDHPKELCSSWVVAAPLMYGLSKIACHITGCCKGIPYDGSFTVCYSKFGNETYFPIQLTEVIVFLIIFLIGLILFIKIDNKLISAVVTMILSFTAKESLDFLRESHSGKVITDNQIFFVICAIITLIIVQFLNRIFNRPYETKEDVLK